VGESTTWTSWWYVPAWHVMCLNKETHAFAL
jgi:hypothetical protein